MSVLQSYNESPLHNLNGSPLHSAGDKGGPSEYDEDLTLPNLTLLGGNARLYYYRDQFLFFNVFYKPANYQYASPIITDIRFTTYFLGTSFGKHYGKSNGPQFCDFNGTGYCINADTFVEFDPINDTRDNHPGWSTDFSVPAGWPTELSFAGSMRPVGYPTVPGDAGFSGDYDAFLSTYSSSYDNTTPCARISNFDPSTDSRLPHINQGTWSEPYNLAPGSQTYNIAGVVFRDRGALRISCAMFFDSPWAFTMQDQSIATLFHGGFICMNERQIQRNYIGPIP